MPGVNDNRRIPCSVSVHHGHFPSNERCPMCAPPVVKAWVPASIPETLRVHVQKLRGLDRSTAEQKVVYWHQQRMVSYGDAEELLDWVEANYP